MSSLGEDARRKIAESGSLLTPAERVARALKLGDDEAEVFRRARGITRENAAAQLATKGRAGRIPSRVAGSG